MKLKTQNLRFKTSESLRSELKRGSILIEAMVAIGITSVGLIGVMSLLTFSFRTNASATQELIGTYLAAEGIEVVKNIVDTAYADIGAALLAGSTPPVWNKDVSDGNFEVEFDTVTLSGAEIGAGVLSTKYLVFDVQTGIYRYPKTGIVTVGTPYKRTIILQVIDNIDCDTDRDDAVKVISKVQWTTPQGDNKEVQLEDHFFDWREESETPTSRKPKVCA